MKLVVPPLARPFHFASTTKNPTDLADYRTICGPQRAPCGASGFLTLPGSRGMAYANTQLAKLLTDARAAKSGLNLQIGFTRAGTLTKFGESSDIDIAGGVHDAGLRDLATTLAKFVDVPVLCTIQPEINGWWSGTHPGDICKAAHARTVGILRSGGADVSFAVGFEPSGADPWKADGTSDFYPGDEWVDWLVLDLFGAETFDKVATIGSVLDAKQKRVMQVLGYAEEHGKPVFFADTSPANVFIDPTLTKGQLAWHSWFVPWLALFQAHGIIRAFSINFGNWSDNVGEDFASWGDSRCVQRNPFLADHWGSFLTFGALPDAAFGPISLPAFQKMHEVTA